MMHVIGLDLSLRASAAVALPVNWSDGLRWPSVRSETFGHGLPKDATEADRCARLRGIADRVLKFVAEQPVRTVWLEEMAFSQRGAMAREIAGLTWLVKVALHEAGYRVRTVPASQARRVFLGHARRGAKADVQQALHSIGAPFAASDDCCDAFVIANFGASEAGGRCLMLGIEGAA